MAIEEEKIQLEQQKLLNQTAGKQAEIELKGQQASLKALENSKKLDQQEEKDDAQLSLQLMQQMDNITEKGKKDA